jgi:hypothetical protein
MTDLQTPTTKFLGMIVLATETNAPAAFAKSAPARAAAKRIGGEVVQYGPHFYVRADVSPWFVGA